MRGGGGGGGGGASVQLSSFAWCIKLKKIFKVFFRQMKRNKKGHPQPIGAARRSSSKLMRISLTDSCTSFAFRQKIGGDYKKLKTVQQRVDNEPSTPSSSSPASSFSFNNVHPGNQIPNHQQKQQQQQRLEAKSKLVKELQSSSLKLGRKWKEVVEMVTVAGNLDDLVDLEEFLGYYLLLRSPVFTSLIHSFFNEFCTEFCEDEERQLVSLFIPELQDFPSFASSEREYECLPPSPCSKQQSFKLK